jgi:ceramide glucosyltransferase
MILSDTASQVLRAAALLLWAASMAYLALGLWFTARFPRRLARPPDDGPAPALTVLKPLCGDEPDLERNIASVLGQRYPGDLQVIFCAQGGDAGLGIARRVAARFPEVDCRFVGCRPGSGGNPKVANLIGAEPFVKHPLVAISDSDVFLARDTLRQVVRKFADPRVGVVTCLYRGAVRDQARWLERMGALHINAWFIPAALVASGLAPVRTAWGQLSVIQRPVLEAAGGFSALARQVADDHELGQMAVRQGLRVELAETVVTTLGCERSLRAMLRRELRWARTSRATNKLGYTVSLIIHPLPVLVALQLVQPGAPGWPAIAALWLGRLALAAMCELKIARAWGWRDWLAFPLTVTVREAVCFAVWAVAHCGRAIVWRGRRYEIFDGARLASVAPAQDPRAIEPVAETADA